MRKMVGRAALMALSPLAAFAGGSKPILLNKTDVGGAVFSRPAAQTYADDGARVTDFLMLMTADKKYEAGMYKSGPAHFSYSGKGTYGVDEFMYLLKGSLKAR